MPGGHTAHLIEVANSLPEGAVLDMCVKLNYFAADKGKSLISRFFIKAEMILFCVYAVFRIIYLKMIFT